MSQNWYPRQQGGGQYGQPQPSLQQSWGHQQNQAWVQGAQWAGQPHPQQTGFYGNQQQFQSVGQPQQPFLGGGQFTGQHQFVPAPQDRSQGPPVPHGPPVPQPQTQFLTQQAYAQEHERRVREEKKKKEMEQQKKKLQSLSVAKPSSGIQSINLDNLFEKQLHFRPTPPPSSTPGTTPPQANPSPQSSQKKEGTQQKQSSKALTWTSNDFTGLFALPQTQVPLETRENDNFGDFQSSGLQSGDFQAFTAASQQPQVANHVQPGSHMMQPGNHMMQTGNHMMQPGNHMMQPGNHMMQTGNHMTQAGHQMMQAAGQILQPGNHGMQPGGHVIQGGSHMISTTAYHEPLSSTNVQQGTQGSKPPGSPQKQCTNSSQFPYSSYSAQSHLTQSFNTPATTSTPGIIAPQQQGSNIGTLHIGNSSPPSVDTSSFHPLYHKVYRLCCRAGEELVSTELLYPVLLSSQLARTQLRDLWGRANRGKPGQLSQMELFVLLGLVGLAQAGVKDPSVEDLRKAPSIPVPTLPGLSALSPTSSVPPPLSPSSSLHSGPPENVPPPAQQTPLLQPSSGPSELVPVGSGTPKFGPSSALPTLPPILTAAKLSPSPAPDVPLSGPPPPSSHLPKANQTGPQDRQPPAEDDFGDFAQFSAPPTTTPLLFPSTTVPSPSPLPPQHLPQQQTDEKNALLSSEMEGWADFGGFSAAPLSTPQPTNDGVRLPHNEQELPNNQIRESPLPHKVAKPSSSKSRMFEFTSSGPQASVPTIDGMEKDLLSKLTPTLPRKSPAATEITEKKKDENEEKPPKTKVEKAMGEEEAWRQCLAKATEVLATCVGVLGEVEEKELLQEIAQAKEAHSTLHGIAEVYRFSKRIFATLSTKYPETAGSAGVALRTSWSELNSLLPDNTMEEVYKSTCPSLPATEPDVLSDTISHCSLCLMSKRISIPSSLSLDSTPEDYDLPLLFHQGQTCHTPCANFWRHLVSEDVPLLG